MLVSVDREGKTARHALSCSSTILSLQRAACQHCLLRRVEGDLAEFAPIHDETFFADDVVNC